MMAVNESLFAASMEKALEGMAMLRRYDLRRGQVLYRFVDVTRSPSPQVAANGPWWLEYEAFQQVKQFGLRHGYSIDYSARLHAAVLYEWSEIGGYVRAEVVQPLVAWKGRGKQVAGTGKDARDLPTMTPMQSVNEIYQLFVPGMHRGTRLFGTALKFLEFLPG
jgi:hypothetical protein